MSIAAIGFEYGIAAAIFTLIQTKGNTRQAVINGGVTTLATTVFVATAALFIPRDKGESEYINERTKESN